LLGAAALAQPPPSERLPGPTVTATGSAQVAVEPDRAVVRLGVMAEAPEAAAAQSQVNATMQAILRAITSLGVAERAIRTEGLSLSPVYGDLRPVPNQQGEREPRIVGYSASNVVTVALDDLEKIGPVVDGAIEAGANQLQGISFEAREDDAARAAALRMAVQDARAQADAIAAAAGMRVAGLREIVAGGADVRPPQPYPAARFALAEATPIQPGQVEVQATVTASYLLEDGAARSGAGRD
jgi:uncharacterized protein YggE